PSPVVLLGLQHDACRPRAVKRSVLCRRWICVCPLGTVAGSVARAVALGNSEARMSRTVQVVCFPDRGDSNTQPYVQFSSPASGESGDLRTWLCSLFVVVR